MARTNSRFNKLLNFIGLVDESDDRGYDYEDGRPQGAATYNPPARRGQAPSSARPVRDQEFDEPRYQARSGNYYEDRAASPRYAQQGTGGARDYPPPRDYRSGRDQGYQSGRQAAPARRAPEYERPAPRRDDPRDQGYQSGRGYPQRQQPAPRYDDYPPRAPQRDYAPPPRQIPEPRREEPPRGNVVNLREGGRAETMIFYLHQLEECRDVITALLDNKTVLLNLEDMDERLIQRGIDTLCGAAFALNATLRKASDKTYLIAPNTVTVETSADERY